MANKIKRVIAVIIVLSGVILNLILYRAETQIKGDPNDNVFQYSLVARTNWIWENYGCPLSLECLPNLVDHNVTYWAEGYALPFYYSHVPQIAIVASYNLIIKPVSLWVNSDLSLYSYYNWTKYLLLALFPLPVFAAFILVGFPLIPAALAAFFAAHFSTDGLYGIDPPSFLWRGWGLTSQLYAMFFMPLGLAFTYRAVKNRSSSSLADYFFSVLFLVLTTAGHLGMGIISLLATAPMLFLDLKKRNIIIRGKKLFLIYISLLFALSYWIIPILLNNQYHIISFWDPIWKFDSYGWYEVVRQYVNGEIFDWQRLPVITVLVTIGFFALLLSNTRFIFSYIFALIMLFYFGRSTWGGLIDFIPGMKDFHLHRFIVGVHIASLFLLPPAFEFIFEKVNKFYSILTGKLTMIKGIRKVTPLLAPLSSLIIISVLIYFTADQTVKYNALNHRWIGEANSAYNYDEKQFLDLLDSIRNIQKGRVYAGRPGNWGHDFRLGSSQIYMLLSVYGFDLTQFLPETWSMMSENDQNFDERVASDYDLLNITHIISPNNPGFAGNVKFDKKFGPFELYRAKTSGWFDVVESPMFVKSDKTDFLNLVYLWHRGWPRTWKMHPLISVEKNPVIPPDMKRQIKMVDEVTFEEAGIRKNIFADFPFIFPDSTPSGKIKSEKVSRQTYSAGVEVPGSCRSCYIMFKMSYHPNWQVTLDGQKVQKFAVFPMYVAVKASPGTHRIEVTHKPNTLKVILIVLEITAIPVLIFFRKKLKSLL